MASTRAVDPQGNERVVRRKWVHRRLRWRGSVLRSLDFLDGAELASAGADLPVVGVLLIAVTLLLLAVAAVVLIVPAVIFLVEPLIVLAIVGLGLLGRVLLGRPWTVEARRHGDEQVFEWKANGFRESRDLVHAVADQLRVTGLPTGGEPVRALDT